MFSLVCNFNDPFDTSINNIKFDPSNVSTEYLKDIEYLKSKFGRDSISKTPKEAIANWVKKSAKSRIDELVITCFSRSHESPLMWAHYADKHHGICLEFTLTKYLSPFKKIKYESINTLEMNYEPPAAPINYLKDKKKAIHLLMSQKSEHWKYEEEYRISTLNKDGLYEFDKSFLTRIVFGMRYDENEIENMKKITEALGYSNINYVSAIQEDCQLGFCNI